MITGDPNLPVERVTWEEAVEFCRRLSELPGEKERRRLYRLPSEAEWEYSCRAGAPVYQTFHCGKSLTSGQANIAGDDCYGGGGGEYRRQTVAVDSFSPNAFGLWQMHGNVDEWCSDWHGNEYYAQSPLADPPGPPKGRSRVTRGGSYRIGWGGCRSAARGSQGPRYKHGDLGFRVVLTLPSE
jgi:sulfatase modifying factor 1